MKNLFLMVVIASISSGCATLEKVRSPASSGTYTMLAGSYTRLPDSRYYAGGSVWPETLTLSFGNDVNGGWQSLPSSANAGAVHIAEEGITLYGGSNFYRNGNMWLTINGNTQFNATECQEVTQYGPDNFPGSAASL